MSTPLKYYPFLDVLRAVAITWVLAFHINIFFDLSPIFRNFYPIIYRLCDPGELGVDIFFVLSGFLIGGLLYEDLGSKIRIKRFYGRRFFKIIPQYLVATLAGLLVSHLLKPFEIFYIQVGWGTNGVNMFESHHPDANVLAHFLLFQNFTHRVGALGHTWSLAVEEHFYLLFPLVLAAICRMSPDIRKRKAILFGFLVSFWIGYLLIKGYYASRHFGIARTLIFNRYDAIAFGCLLRLLEPKLQRIPQDRWRICSSVFLLSGLVLFAGYFLEFNRLSIWGYPRASLATGLLILAFLRGEPFGFLKPIMNSKTLISLGKNSYGLYLWHYIIIFPFHKWTPFLGLPGSLFLYIGTVLTAGLVSTNVIEKYFLNLRAKVLP